MSRLSVLLILCLFNTIFGFYSSNLNIKTLTEDNFDQVISKKPGIWLVEFYANWCQHCKNFAPEFSKAASALNGFVNVGAVDVDNNRKLLEKYQINGYPTVLIFGGGKEPKVFNGARNAQGLVDAAFEAARKKINTLLNGKKEQNENDFVTELNDANFNSIVLKSNNPWFVMFHAPWCGHCKNLKPYFEAAAKELKDAVKFGAVDATIHTALSQKYLITGYPTLKFFPSNNKESPEDYNLSHSKDDIVTFLTNQIFNELPAPEIREVINQEVFNEECVEKSLCIVTVLPHILDCQSSCRNIYLDVLRNLSGGKFKSARWGWIWAEAGAQADLENALDVGGFGYPALAVLSHKKSKFSLFKGSFSLQGLNEFLRDLSFGRVAGQTSHLKGKDSTPKINEIIPWDGKDAANLPVEDEEEGDEDKQEEDQDQITNMYDDEIRQMHEKDEL